MSLAAEKEYAHIGETCGCADHDYDLVHELNRRLEALWRYDQYIANAEEHPALQAFWREMKAEDADAVKRLKGLLKKEIEEGCF